MKIKASLLAVAVLAVVGLFHVSAAQAALTLTSGTNATTTPNIATAITGFQIVGPAASTTPVKLFTTSGTLSMSTTTGLTFNGASSGSVIYFSGTVQDINAALATLTYTRSSTGSDTLEVSLVNSGEVFYTGNNHLYKFISGAYTWNQAKTAAENQTAYGVPGYLATISSSNENTFVSGRLTGDGWIGASDDTSQGTIEGNWIWATGPEAGIQFWQGTGSGQTVGGNYANWNAGEPNNAGNENCAETYVSSGHWNDLNCSSPLGYVIEFGTPDALPTVVAKNISIVTADVPAITSLTPSNGNASVSPSANFTLGFSKAVTPDTGTILIRKVSDDSIVASIDVSGSQVTGGGTNSITLNPPSDLPEGTELYVTIPNTAFKDSSSNYFNGITSTTTWVFTTTDITPPVISNIIATAATTTAGVTWDTNESASTKLWYSINNATDISFGSSTTEIDTSPRVTEHSVSLSNLLACTLYHYDAVSSDLSRNTATSSSDTFITTGCLGGVTPSTATSSLVMVNATTTQSLNDTNHIFSVETPTNFTSTSSSVVIQIKGVDADAALASLGKPSATIQSAASVAFEVTALVDNTTTLDSFDAPVSITYHYTDADVSGLNESTLKMYHYHNGAWIALNSCTVDTSGNTITCTTPSFSLFAIFGTPLQTTVNNYAPLTSMGGIYYACRNPQASNYESIGASDPARCIFPPAPATQTIRDLFNGLTGADVKALQQLLNTYGFILAQAGAGSPGNETTTFGPLTRKALAAYQKAKGVAPDVGYFGPLTRAQMKADSLAGIWW